MAIEKVVKISVDQVQASGGLEKFVAGLEKTEQSATSLRTELKNLKQQLAELPEGTAQYEKIAKRAGEVSDKIGDISTRVKNLGSDTKNIDAVVQGAQTLSGAFAVASSASALLGDNNEDLQKTMVKVESAIALTVGIQSISNALQKESALVIGATNLATKAQIVVQKLWTAATQSTNAATQTLKATLVSTGIGAIVVAVGFLISALYSASDATEELTAQQKQLNKELEFSKELTDSLTKSIDYYTQIDIENAKKRGASDKELRKIQIDGINDKLKANTDEINSIKSTQDKEYGLTAEQNKRIADLRNQNLDLVRQGNLQIAQFEAEQAQKSRDAEKERLNKLSEAQKKALEDAKKKREEELADLKAFNQKITDAYISQFDIDIDNKKAQVDELAKLGAQNTANEAAESEARKKIAELEAKAKTDSLNGYASAISQVSGIIGTQTAIGKTVAIASSLINTYASITGQLKAFSGVPIPGYAIAQAIATGAVGFANVAKIASVKVPNAGGGGSAGSPASSGGGSSTPPSFNIVGQNSNNQLAQSIANKQSQPIQAYVVSGNVSSAQSLDRNRVETSTFN